GSLGNQLDAATSVWTDGERFIVGDGNNNRVLIWSSRPTSNGARADVALGAESVDARGNPNVVSATTMGNFPAVASDGQRIFVADAHNNRVLVWNSFPSTSGTPADVVVGQNDFASNASGTSATALNFPVDVEVAGDNLLVSDQINHRVLVFSPQPVQN